MFCPEHIVGKPSASRREDYANELDALGRKVLTLRTEAGLSQEQLEDASGVRRLTISGIENAKIDPQLVTLLRLAGAFGVNVADLLSD